MSKSNVGGNTTLGAGAGLFMILSWVSFLFIGGIGWVDNIIKLVGEVQDSTAITAIEVLRGIGIFFFPLGAVLGWF